MEQKTTVIRFEASAALKLFHQLNKHKLKYNHLRKADMDISEIAEHMTGKQIEAIDVVYGEDILTIYLSDGSDVELIVDSIYCNVPDLDD
jgi:hypothetical protein